MYFWRFTPFWLTSEALVAVLPYAGRGNNSRFHSTGVPQGSVLGPLLLSKHASNDAAFYLSVLRLDPNRLSRNLSLPRSYLDTLNCCDDISQSFCSEPVFLQQGLQEIWFHKFMTKWLYLSSSSSISSYHNIKKVRSYVTWWCSGPCTGTGHLSPWPLSCPLLWTLVDLEDISPVIWEPSAVLKNWWGVSGV